MFTKTFRIIMLGLVTPVFIGSSPVWAVTESVAEKKLGFVRSLSVLKSSLSLPSSAEVESLPIPVKKLKTRVFKGSDDSIIEPVFLGLPKDEDKISELANKLAAKGDAERLDDLFLEQLKKIGPTETNSVRIEITPEIYDLMNPEKLAREFGKTHYNVTIHSKELAASRSTRKTLMDQLVGFFPRKQRLVINDKIAHGDNLKVDQDLLTPFAKKMVKKYLVVRGPNCFHAALAFHSQKFASSPFINVKEEPGYHKSMINYDVLWRVLSHGFYEVDVDRYPLKYGDMIVFFNMPSSDENKPISYRSIRHTATYLFGPYTFSKGSKSPDTPYTVKTLEEEWKTWLGYTANLGVKVYRRNQKGVPKELPKDLTDWIY